MFLRVDANRNLLIKDFDLKQFKVVGNALDQISIGNGQADQTSDLLAYRKQFNDQHGSGLGAVFINLQKLFPCVPNNIPMCHLYPNDDEGFRKGKALIEVSDWSNIRVFGSNVKTYGFTITDCPVLDGADGCLSTYFDRVLVCYLPRGCLETA